MSATTYADTATEINSYIGSACAGQYISIRPDGTAGGELFTAGAAPSCATMRLPQTRTERVTADDVRYVVESYYGTDR